MLRNYFLIALRNLWRNKFYAAVNIAGLGLGIACCLALVQAGRHEITFNHAQSRADRIYRVVFSSGEVHSGATPYALATALRPAFPDFERITQTHGPTPEKISVPNPDGTYRPYKESRVLYADPAFLQTLDFTWRLGNPKNALREPNTVLLTEQSAEKYFPGENPLGRILRLGKDVDMKVIGVLANPPKNTNLPFRMLISYKTFERLNPQNQDDWNTTWAGTVYVTLRPDDTPERYANRLRDFIRRTLPPDQASRTSFALQPLKSVHTDEQYSGAGFQYTAPPVIIAVFFILAFIGIATACVNYVNLATAQAVTRSKEVGVRKVMGGSRLQLIVQFMGESAVLVLLAIGLGLALTQFFLDHLNSFLAVIQYDLQLDRFTLAAAAGLWVVVTMLSGLYPALVISGFRPVQALKSTISSGRGTGSFNMRKALVVTQFTFSTLLVLLTLVAALQLRHMQEQPFGFRKDNLLIVNLPDADAGKRKQMHRLLGQLPGVEQVSFGFRPPLSNGGTWTDFKMAGRRDPLMGQRKIIDENYVGLFGLQLLAGDNLRPTLEKDTLRELLINDKLRKALNFASPAAAIGQTVRLDQGQNQGVVRGVVSDFQNVYLREEISPCVLHADLGMYYQVFIRPAQPDKAQLMADVQRVFTQAYPNEVFEPEWLDDHLRGVFVVDNLMYGVFRAFALLSVVVGCLGLYGLVTFVVHNRTKEIGIRKVLGASAFDVARMLSASFLKLVTVAVAIALPFGGWAAQSWLSNYTSRVPLDWFWFAGVAGVMMLLTLVTVGYQSLKAAMANPVKSLRND